MKYNLVHLEELRHVPNLGTFVEQIDHAATLATEEMRRYGLSLPSEVPDGEQIPPRVPMLHEVDTYLRYLVVSAYEGFMIAKSEAPAGTPDEDIEGYPDIDDPLFDVVVTGLEEPVGFLTVRIARRLTG